MGRLFLILPTAAGPYEIPPHVRVGLYAKYRGIDVDRELQLMALWLEKNPARRPVKPIRFAEKWLDKCKGVNAQPVRPKVAGVANPPFAPPSNGNGRTPTPNRDRMPVRLQGPSMPPINGGVATRKSAGDPDKGNLRQRKPPPINGAAAASPTQTSDASPLLVAAAAPPSIRSSVGPRSIGDVIGQLRAAIGVRNK
jgi:hypothetical protein